MRENEFTKILGWPGYRVQVIGDAPFGFFWASPTPPQFATPFVDLFTGNVEGQRFPVVAPPLNVSPAHPDPNINWAQFEPISSSPGYLYTNRTPYAEDYMLSVQRQFGSNTVVNLSYVGTQGHRLLLDLEANPSIPALCLQAEAAGCGPFAETGSFTLSSGQVIVPRQRLGANFGSNGWYGHLGNSNFNALETSLRHTSGRLSVLAGYTYSKSIDQASALNEQINPFNQRLTRAISAFDLTHNFVVSYNYELPFGKLWRANPLTQGWVVTGTTRFSTGLPVTIMENDDHGLDRRHEHRPKRKHCRRACVYSRQVVAADRSAKGWAVLQHFAVQAGTHRANREFTACFFHGPGINNWDMALLKDLRLTECKALQFRGEFFNAFNHAQFNAPNGNFLNSAFGLVTSPNAPRIGQVALKFLF